MAGTPPPLPAGATYGAASPPPLPTGATTGSAPPLPAGATMTTAGPPPPPPGTTNTPPPTPQKQATPPPAATPQPTNTPLPPGGFAPIIGATPRPQVSAGLTYSNPVEKTDLLNGTRTSQNLINGLGSLEQRGFRMTVTAVRGDHHDDGPNGHAGGKATDVGLVNGVAPGNNPQTRAFLESAIESGDFTVIGTTGSIANDPQLQSLARQHGVTLRVDEGTGPHVHLQVGDGPTTPQAGVQHANPVQTFVHAAQHVYEAANTFWVEAAARMKESAVDPLGAAVNVEQTPTRMLDTFIVHGVRPEQFAHAFQNALNPGEGDESYNAVTGRILRWMQQHDPAMAGGGYDRAIDAITHNTIGRLNPTIATKVTELQNKVRDFAYQFVAQSLADPVTYFPFLGVLGDVAKAAKLTDMVSASAKAVGGTRAGRPLAAGATALRAAHGKILDATLNNPVSKLFHQRPELDAVLDPPAKGARIGYEHARIVEMHHELGEPDAHLLESNRKGLKGVKTSAKGYVLPDEIRQRYLQEPWRYGTPEMRQQAEALGYKPTAADKPWLEKPEGLLDYNVRDDYQYLGKVGANIADSPAFKKYRNRLPKVATFEHERLGNYAKIDADQYERVKARLSLGRNTVWQRRANNDTAAYLARHGGAKGLDLTPGGDQAAKAEKFNQFVDGLTTGPVRYDSPLRIFGRLGTQAVQGTFLPHAVNNVGTLEFLKSPIGLGRAIGYMTKGVSEAQVSRLQRLGAVAEYTTDPGSVWSKIWGSKQALEFGQRSLSEMEMAYRQGLLDELDRTMGPSFDRKTGQVTNEVLEMQKGQVIRDALVDYRNVPLVIAWMEAAGAPFAAFFGGLVKAVGKAALTHPERVGAVQRGTRDVQDDFGTTIPSPVNTFDRLIGGGGFDPAQVARTVAQHGGPLGSALASIGDENISSLGQWLAEQVSRWGGPWISQIPDFFSLPYTLRGTTPGTPSVWQGILHALAGLYPYTPPSRYKQQEIQRSANRAEEE